MTGALSNPRRGGRVGSSSTFGAPGRLTAPSAPNPTLAAVALGAGLAAAPGAARASGLDAPIVGSAQSGPTAVDAAAIHWNPAQLAFIERTEVLMGASLILGHVGYTRERRGAYQTADSLEFKTPLEPGNIDAGKTGTAEEVVANPIAPTAEIFLAAPALKDRLVLGLGMYVPYAAALNFPADGPQAWQIRQAFIVASHLTASAGVRVNDQVAVGAGLTYVGGFAELSKLQDFASLQEFRDAFAGDPIRQENDFGPDAPSEVRELDTLSRPISIKRAVSHGVSFNLGLALRPAKDLGLGLTYQHGARMRYVGDFAIDMNDEFFTQDLAAQGLQYKPLVEGEAALSFALPKRITAGVAYDVSPSLRLDGFVSWVRYSELDAFVVETTSPDLAQPRLGIGDRVRVRLPREWNDTVWIEASGRYRLSPAMLVSASLGYQSPASPDATIDVASPDGHRLIGGLGAVLQASEHVALLGHARLQGILPRTVTESRNDLGNGTYSLFLATVGGHLHIVF